VGQQQSSSGENKRFGTYLRRIREERRLSLDAVEEMSGELNERVTKSHLSRIENGQAIPTFPRMFALSQVYGIPVSLLAERFELCLLHRMFPREAERKAGQELLDEAKRLRRSGRHSEALALYELLLERPDEISVIDVRLERINCLVKLSREATAKEACEKLLGSPQLTPRQNVITLQYFAICCYRLAKYTVAMMAIEKAEQGLREVEDSGSLGAHLAALKGNLFYITKRFDESAEAFGRALQKFDEARDGFEVCRTRLNLAAALIETGAVSRARAYLDEALQQAEAKGYDRQRAFAFSHLGRLAYREGDLDAAEGHCLRSNRIARPREYVSILFCNCYYLWRIAQARRDEAGIKVNERTLRTYLGRVEGYLAEAAEFRVHLAGGDGA
jgi:tetratricopeptide (TPR) repeat protein